MQKKKINITLDGISGIFQKRLSRIMQLTSFGLKAVQKMDSVPKEIPNAFLKLQMPLVLGEDLGLVTQEYIRWIISHGLRDAIEAMNLCIEEAQKCCFVFKFSSEKGYLTGAELNKLHEKAIEFHRLPLPSKFEKMSSEYGSSIMPQTQDSVISINKARTCLVHRDGKVTKLDMNFEEKLVVKWKHVQLMAVQPDGTVLDDLTEPVTIEAGGSVGLKVIEKEKVFNKGENIIFTEQEFVTLCLSLYLFAHDLTIAATKYGQEIGMIPIAQKNVKSVESATELSEIIKDQENT